MALHARDGKSVVQHGAHAPTIHQSQDSRVVIIERGTQQIVPIGASDDHRFISVVTTEDRNIVHWRDYIDSLAAMTALAQASYRR